MEQLIKQLFAEINDNNKSYEELLKIKSFLEDSIKDIEPRLKKIKDTIPTYHYEVYQDTISDKKWDIFTFIEKKDYIWNIFISEKWQKLAEEKILALPNILRKVEVKLKK